MEDKADITKRSISMDESNLVIIRLQGMFYNAYEDSARVLSLVTGYKIKQVSKTSKLKCGFPSNALEKNTGLLIENCINFRITDKDEVVSEGYFENNQFNNCLHDFDDGKVVRAWETETEKSRNYTRIDSVKKKTECENNRKESIFERLKNLIKK